MTFETIIWIEAVDEHFGWSGFRYCEEGLHPVKVLWPTAMEFTNGRDDWYTLLTEGQGLLIPNTWKTELWKSFRLTADLRPPAAICRGLAR